MKRNAEMKKLDKEVDGEKNLGGLRSEKKRKKSKRKMMGRR